MFKDIPSNVADVAALLDGAASSYEQWMNKLAIIHDIRYKMCQCVAEARHYAQAAVQSNVTAQDCVYAKEDFNNMRHFGADVKKLLDMVLDAILPESRLKQFTWKDDIDVVFSESDDIFDCVDGTIRLDIVSKKLKRAVAIYVPVKDAVDVDFLNHDVWNGKYVVKALSPEFSLQQDKRKTRRELCVIAVYTFPSSVIEALDAYFSGKLDHELEHQTSTCSTVETTRNFVDYDMAVRSIAPYAGETSVSYIDRTLFDSLDAAEIHRYNRANQHGPSIDRVLDDNYLLAPFRKSI